MEVPEQNAAGVADGISVDGVERISKLHRGRSCENLHGRRTCRCTARIPEAQNGYTGICIVENEVPDYPGKTDPGSQDTENGKFADGFPDASGFAFFYKMHQENGRQRECHHGNI